MFSSHLGVELERMMKNGLIDGERLSRNMQQEIDSSLLSEEVTTAVGSVTATRSSCSSLCCAI